MTDRETYEKGLAGESQAVQYLQTQGFQLLQKRYRASGGEIDAVMLEQDTLVFVEVKLRNTGTSGDGLIAVTTKKQRRIIKTALFFLAEYEHDGPIRFDIVEVTADGIQHIRNAFQGKEF